MVTDLLIVILTEKDQAIVVMAENLNQNAQSAEALNLKNKNTILYHNQLSYP
jgi:hypothetical protein